MRIVIVDDALFMRVHLKHMLEDLGCDIVGEGCNGEEAIDLVKQRQPDMITLDITMPVMNGIDALRQIKQQHPHVSVLIVSAMGQESMIRDAIQLGATDFLIKPFKKVQVANLVAKHTPTARRA